MIYSAVSNILFWLQVWVLLAHSGYFRNCNLSGSFHSWPPSSGASLSTEDTCYLGHLPINAPFLVENKELMPLFFGAPLARTGENITGPVNRRLQHETVTFAEEHNDIRDHLDFFIAAAIAAAAAALDQCVWAQKPWLPSSWHKNALVYTQSLPCSLPSHWCGDLLLAFKIYIFAYINFSFFPPSH